jgi:hypothetical protein
MDILQANSNAVMSKAGNPERLLMVKQDMEYYSGGGQILKGSRLISVNLVYSDNPCLFTLIMMRFKTSVI